MVSTRNVRLFLMTLFLCAVAPFASAQTRVALPQDTLTREPFLSQVQLSPDGQHMAAISSLDGENRQIAIWRTSALGANPRRFGIGGGAARANSRFASIEWVSNDRLLVLMQQPIEIGSGTDGRFFTAVARIVNLDGSSWIEPLPQTGRRSELETYADKFLAVSLLDTLPSEPNHVLMMRRGLDDDSIYRVDVRTGRGELVERMSSRESILPVVDASGRARVKQTIDYQAGDWIIGTEIADANGTWQRHDGLTYTARARRGLTPIAFDPENQDILIFVDDEGQNLPYVRGYSISQRRFVETMFQHPEFEASGVLLDSVALAPTRIVGFTYQGDAERAYYIDDGYRALAEGLQRQLPGRIVRIGPRNGNYRIIRASSSRHPPTYYLMTDDRTLTLLGESVPGVPSDQLAETRLVHYTARDGLRIPAFLTLPAGFRPGVDAPLPTIIQPHGGPWGRNDADWGGGDIPVTQYYASRGFAVLQPQFRGSTGFGNALWRAGDGEWGQKMQDDKDDGLAWLIQERIADPQRAMIYGFSYGGFAAIAATVRPNSPYRCAISGAGVSSLERLGTLWSSNRVQRQLQGTTVRGMDPLEHASDAGIPILLYHGDFDTSADIWHSERFAAALRAANKPHEYIVIPGMPHGAITPDMRRREFQIVDDYIRGTCGINF